MNLQAGKYIVWFWQTEDADGREDKRWVEQGDGPLTRNQADRIAKEMSADFFNLRTRVEPVGFDPNSLVKSKEVAS